MRKVAPVAVVVLLGLTAACVSSTSDSTAAAAGSPSGTSTGAGGSKSTSGASSSGAGAGTTTASSSASTSTGTSSGGTTYACEVKSALLHFCVLYEDLTAAELASEQAGCASLLGTSGTTCPTTGVLGTCTATAAGITGVTTWYSDGGTTAAEAQTSCAASLGTWTPG